MKVLLASALLLFGIAWTCYGSLVPMTMKTRAASDAGQAMLDLYRWADEKKGEGKLLDSDIAEIFPDGYASLRFGGENEDRDFSRMMRDTAVSSAVPLWPGLLACGIGLAGFLSRRTNTPRT